MGHSPRPKPSQLARKLLVIRQELGMSQTEMCKALGLKISYSAISNYELATREPPLPVILRYARLARVSTDYLIDDDLELPVVLPVPSKKQVGVVKRPAKR